MALGSTQPLTEMSTRNISWVFYFVQFHPAVYVYLIVYYLMSVVHS
jgi:hypothetical protein